jgi:hypothetical protein
MTGKVIFYSEETGEGIILTVDKKKYKFNIMEWQDFNNMPKAGLNVSFDELTEQTADNITTIEEVEQSTDENTNHRDNNSEESSNSDSSNLQNDEDREDVKVSSTENGIKPVAKDNSKNMASDSVAKDVSKKASSDKTRFNTEDELLQLENIPLDLTVDEVLGQYFEKAIKAIKDEGVDKRANLLNYSLMKRFLNTAYNHLADKDPGFIDRNLMELKTTLEELNIIHHEMADKKQFPDLKFETVFLKYQKTYVQIEREYEKNQSQFKNYNISASNVSKKIKTAESRLKELSIKSKEYSDLDLNTKRLRSKYVRILDVLALIEKTNRKYKELMDDFKLKTKDDFITKFKHVADNTFDILTISLNSKAYRFDQCMWDLAKKSQGIKKFFLEAQIEGGFSSKTFLKYFLSSLDKSKMNQEHKDMKKLLEYLESLEKRQIVIVDDKSEMLPSLTYFANHLDRNFKVTTSIPSDAIRLAFYSKIEYMIVNINTQRIKLFDFIQSINRLERGIEFILISDSFTKDLVVKAKKLNVEHFVVTKTTDEALLANLNRVIKGEEV